MAADGAYQVDDRLGDDGGAQELVGHQQRIDLLLEAARSASTQYSAAQDGGFQFQVGGLDLPSLMVERDQLSRWVAVRVEQEGGQPVTLSMVDTQALVFDRHWVMMFSVLQEKYWSR